VFENTYPANQSVQLYAIPATGYSFSEWKGSLTDTSQASKDTIIVTMSCPKQLTAVFIPENNPATTGSIPKLGIGIGIAAAVGLILFLLIRLVISRRTPSKVA
jgi:hypothetical protein